MKAGKTSAGLLLFRQRAGQLEFLLAHPGGPFFQKKDDGVWTVPKGEAEPGEDLLTRARIEFEEEMGTTAPLGEFFPLGFIQQKGGKIVHAWAIEGDLPNEFAHKSNTLRLEWPPRSGRYQEFPEIDRAEFFPEAIARVKIKAAQVPFLDRVRERLTTR